MATFLVAHLGRAEHLPVQNVLFLRIMKIYPCNGAICAISSPLRDIRFKETIIDTAPHRSAPAPLHNHHKNQLQLLFPPSHSIRARCYPGPIVLSSCPRRVLIENKEVEGRAVLS